MAINFPSNPSLNDIFTSGNSSWRWNGVSWKAANISTSSNSFFISVKDYGAKGDGVTDDTVAIQTCIDDIYTRYDPRNEDSVSIYFPRGKYLISSSLWVGSYTTLYGDGQGSIIFTNNSSIKQLIKLQPAKLPNGSGGYVQSSVGSLIVDANYIITSKGSTTDAQWNAIAGQTGSWQPETNNGNTYSTTDVGTGSPSVGDTFTARQVGTGLGTGTVTQLYNAVVQVVIKDLGLQTAGTDGGGGWILPSSNAWAIKNTAAFIGESRFENLVISSKYHLSLARYTQSCVISNILARLGPTEQMLHLCGNRNTISNIDKDDSVAGSTDEPIILIDGFHMSPEGYYLNTPGSDGNMISNCLIEGACKSSKPALKIQYVTHIVIDNFWTEMPDSSNPSNAYIGNAFVLNSVGCAQFKGYIQNAGARQYFSITKCEEVIFDRLRVPDWDVDNYNLTSYLNVDGISHVRIKQLLSSIGKNVYPVASLANNITIDEVQTVIVNYSDTVNKRFSKPNLVTSNALVNPSFDAGLYGWTVNGNISTSSFDDSYFSFGKLFNVTWLDSSANQIYQNFTITSSMIGMPFTFSCYVDVTTGSSTGFVAPWFSGAGVGWGGGVGPPYNLVSPSTGVHFITQTVIPSQTGTMQVGVYSSDVQSFKIGECCFQAGNVAVPNQTSIKSVSLNGKTILYASSPPSNGGWKVGSKVFNETPAIGQPKGWVCTASTNSSSTWISEGDLGSGSSGSSTTVESVSTNLTATSTLSLSQMGTLVYTGTSDANWTLYPLNLASTNGVNYKIFNPTPYTLYLWSYTPSSHFFVEPSAKSTYDPTFNPLNTLVKGYAIPCNAYIDVVAVYNGSGNPYWLVRDNKGCIAASPPGTAW